MATITAHTSSVFGEYLDVKDPNTWIGGTVPGPGDRAVFPARVYKNLNAQYSNNASSFLYWHPYLAPWSGSQNPDGSHVTLQCNSTTTLGLEEASNPSKSFYSTLHPFDDPTRLIKINYDSKASAYFYSCSLDSTNHNVSWSAGNVAEYSDADGAVDGNVCGRIFYNTTYVVRNPNQYILTGSWDVGHIDLKAFCHLKLTGSAHLKLVSSTVGDPMIDLKNNAAIGAVIEVLDESIIEISGSQTETSTYNGLYTYNINDIAIILSGSSNYSSSFVSESISAGDTEIRISSSTAFQAGDIISIQNTGSFRHRVENTSSIINYNRTVNTGVYFTGSGFSTSSDATGMEAQATNNFSTTGVWTGDIMKDELTRIITMSGDTATVAKYLSRKGYIQQDMGSYTYRGFVESFTTPIDYFQGTKKAILVNSTHKSYKTGEKIIIGNKAYTIDGVGTYLSQSHYIDYRDATTHPSESLVWNRNEYSGSNFTSQTTNTGTYYWWNEVYRKGTLWGTGSIGGERSLHVDSASIRSYTADAYNVTKYDTYAHMLFMVSGSYFSEGEIELSASVTNTQIGDTYDEQSGVSICWPCAHNARASAYPTYTQGHRALGDDIKESQIFGFTGRYGAWLKQSYDSGKGAILPFSKRTYDEITYSDDLVNKYNELMPPCNATASGESFSIKWVVDGYHNKFFYRDKGGETQVFESNCFNKEGGVQIGIQDWAKLYTISIKQRYQVLLLDTTDSFSWNDEILDGGTLYSHDATKPIKWIATRVKDAMGYKNLLWDWYEKRGQTAILPYLQGATYLNANYGHSSYGQYLHPKFNSQNLFEHKDFGAGFYYSYNWANAGFNNTIDLGTPVTFDTIGIVSVGGTQYEGTSNTQKGGANNYMKSVEIKYNTSHSTHPSSFETVWGEADDTRRSTGMTGIRYYTFPSGAITAQVLQIHNAGGSNGTAYTDMGFIGVYNGQSGSTSHSIELENVNNFKVGDHIYFSSHLEMSDHNFNPASARGVQNYIEPAEITDYNVGSDEDTDAITNGGFRKTYEIKTISGNVVGLDRKPVYSHITKGTLAYKANRGNVRLKVNSRGREWGGFNIYSYGQNATFKIHNAWIDGFLYSYTATSYRTNIVDVQDSTFTPPYTGYNGIYTSGRGNFERNVLVVGRHQILGRNDSYQMLNAMYNVLVDGFGDGGAVQENTGVSYNTNFCTCISGDSNGFPFYASSQANTSLPSIYFKAKNNWIETYYAADAYFGRGDLAFGRNKFWEWEDQYINSFYWQISSTSLGYTYYSDQYMKEYWNRNKWSNGYLYNQTAWPQYMNSGLHSYYQGDMRTLKDGVLLKNHKLFNGKDVIFCGNIRANSPMLAISSDNNDNFTLHGINGGTTTSQTYQGTAQFKFCTFIANEDCEINIQAGLDYILDATYLCSLGETYGTTGGQTNQALSNGYQVEYDGVPRFAFMERIPPASEGYIRDMELINDISRSYVTHNYNKSFSIKKGNRYEFMLVIPQQYKYFHKTNPIWKYKNPSFNIFTNDLNNITIHYSTFGIEKLFNTNKHNFPSTSGEMRGTPGIMGNQTVVRLSNDTGTRTLINKIKL